MEGLFRDWECPVPIRQMLLDIKDPNVRAVPRKTQA